LWHKAVSGVALAGNPERDWAADRTVVPLAAAVEGGRAGSLVQMPQADHGRRRRWRGRRAVAARDEREVVDLEALAGHRAGRAADDKDDRIAVVLGGQRHLRQGRPLRAGQRAVVALEDERAPARELLQ